MSAVENWKFTLNGRAVETQASGDTPLLFVLRNAMDTRTVRFGCGEGECGACSVIVDGRARTSCDLPVCDAAGTSIETVEGFSWAGEHHAIVQALIDEQAGQCGYCLPGIVVRLKALLDEFPKPTRGQIVDALDDNLCRCGAQPRILRAVMNAAASHPGER
jgi:nicotinate dehydrogenase subunit A